MALPSDQSSDIAMFRHFQQELDVLDRHNKILQMIKETIEKSKIEETRLDTMELKGLVESLQEQIKNLNKQQTELTENFFNKCKQFEKELKRNGEQQKIVKILQNQNEYLKMMNNRLRTSNGTLQEKIFNLMKDDSLLSLERVKNGLPQSGSKSITNNRNPSKFIFRRRDTFLSDYLSLARNHQKLQQQQRKRTGTAISGSGIITRIAETENDDQDADDDDDEKNETISDKIFDIAIRETARNPLHKQISDTLEYRTDFNSVLGSRRNPFNDDDPDNDGHQKEDRWWPVRTTEWYQRRMLMKSYPRSPPVTNSSKILPIKDTKVSSKDMIVRNIKKNSTMIKSKKTFKVILVGDSTVGKTTLITRIRNNSFILNPCPTIGIDFQTIQVRIDDDHYDVQLWDTAGQERYHSIINNYYRRVDAIGLMYDVHKEKTFLNIRNWITSIRETVPESIPLLLIGNKIDIRMAPVTSSTSAIDNNNFISYESGKRFSMQNENCNFMEISCRTGTGVDEAILLLVRMILENQRKNRSNHHHLQKEKSINSNGNIIGLGKNYVNGKSDNNNNNKKCNCSN